MNNTQRIPYSITLLSTLVLLISCGGGGGDSSSGTGTVAGGGAAGEEGGGDQGGGDQGGEGAGNCKSVNHKRFRFDLVQEITPPSAPPTKKMIVIRGYSGSPENRNLDLIFTTNDGIDEGANDICEIECGNPAFVDEYEQAFGVINTDCNA